MQASFFCSNSHGFCYEPRNFLAGIHTVEVSKLNNKPTYLPELSYVLAGTVTLPCSWFLTPLLPRRLEKPYFPFLLRTRRCFFDLILKSLMRLTKLPASHHGASPSAAIRRCLPLLRHLWTSEHPKLFGRHHQAGRDKTPLNLTSPSLLFTHLGAKLALQPQHQGGSPLCCLSAPLPSAPTALPGLSSTLGAIFKS